jgi:hypothetical protein
MGTLFIHLFIIILTIRYRQSESAVFMCLVFETVVIVTTCVKCGGIYSITTLVNPGNWYLK